MNAKTLLKWSTIASSLLLMTAFVSYRGGAFERLIDTSDAAGVSPDRVAVDQHGAEILTCPSDPNGPLVEDEHIFYSSKSGAVFVEPAGSGSKTPQPPDNSTTIFGGSKYLMPSSAPSGKGILVTPQESAGGASMPLTVKRREPSGR